MLFWEVGIGDKYLRSQKVDWFVTIFAHKGLVIGGKHVHFFYMLNMLYNMLL